MPELDEVARQLEDDSNLRDVRRAIATLMLHHLYALHAMPRCWDKAHFANAVTALTMNIHAAQQPTDAWLRLCLVNLRKAIESIQPNAPYTPRDRHLDEVSLDELIATVEALSAHA